MSRVSSASHMVSPCRAQAILPTPTFHRPQGTEAIEGQSLWATQGTSIGGAGAASQGPAWVSRGAFGVVLSRVLLGACRGEGCVLFLRCLTWAGVSGALFSAAAVCLIMAGAGPRGGAPALALPLASCVTLPLAFHLESGPVKWHLPKGSF